MQDSILSRGGNGWGKLIQRNVHVLLKMIFGETALWIIMNHQLLSRTVKSEILQERKDRSLGENDC